MRNQVLDQRNDVDVTGRPEAAAWPERAVHAVLQKESSWPAILHRAATEARARQAPLYLHHLLDASMIGLCHEIFPGLPSAWFDDQRAHLRRALEEAPLDGVRAVVVDVECCHLDHVARIAERDEPAAVVVEGSRGPRWLAWLRTFLDGAMEPALRRRLGADRLVVVRPRPASYDAGHR